MKNLLKYVVVILLAISVASCGKKDNTDADSAGNGYSYKGKKIKTNKAEYLLADDDVYLFFSNTASVDDFLQIRFAKNSLNTIKAGTTYTLNLDRNTAFNPQLHFWGGSVTAANPLNAEFESGTVTVSEISTSKIKINYALKTENGDEVKGAYDGNMVKR